MERLKELLERVKKGGLVISTVLNQAREEIPDEVLRFREGKWLLRRINCRSSSDLGLGVCRCESHPAVIVEEITHDEAVKLLAQYYQRKKMEEERRGEETRKVELMIEIFSELEKKSVEELELIVHKLHSN